jgi:hypothetical protein
MPVHQAATTRRLQVTRRRAAVLVAMLLALLVGCSRAQPNEVTFKTSGSEGRVGDIVVTDTMFNFRGPLQTSAVYQPGRYGHSAGDHRQ